MLNGKQQKESSKFDVMRDYKIRFEYLNDLHNLKKVRMSTSFLHYNSQHVFYIR